MNKIFRIIWSKTLNRFVVVSELATGQCKASSSGQKLADNSQLSKLPKFALSQVALKVALAAGVLGMSSISYAGWHGVWMKTESGVVKPAYMGDADREARNSILLAPTEGNTRASNANVVANSSVIIGVGQTFGKGGQSTVVGSSSVAGAQATAVGNDVYATGSSSIALGNDDIARAGAAGFNNDINRNGGKITAGEGGFVDRLPENTIKRIYGDYTGNFSASTNIRTALSDSMDWNTFYNKYVKSGNSDNRIYSPTYAKGIGAIAIGSRSVAFGNGSTTLGTLSFALADRSTAIGLRAFADFSATGATAIGEETRVFAPNTIAMGNHSEAVNRGSLAFGANSRAVGVGSVAIGENVLANAKVTDISAHNFETLLKQSAHIDGTPVVGSDNQIIASAFGSSNGQNNSGYVSDRINRIFLKLHNTDQSDDFTYNLEKENDIVITTTEDVKKTKKAGDYGVSLGYYVLNQANNGIGIGSATAVFGSNSIAIGALSYASKQANNSMAIGVGTNVQKENSISIGTATSVLGAGSVGLGIGALVEKDNSVSIGYGVNNKSAASIGIGNGVNLSLNRNENAFQIGMGNNAKVSVIRGIAIGDSAEVTSLENSVALGYRSKVDYTPAELAKPGYTARGSYSIPSSSRVGVLSVGSQGFERRIINVASGYRDSDAVTVSQLKTIEDRIDGAAEATDDSMRYFSVKQSDGETKVLADLGRRKLDYQNYVRYLTQRLTVKARIADGENVNESEPSLVEMGKKLDAFIANANIKDKPSHLKALLAEVYTNGNLSNVGSAFNKNSGKYWNGGSFKIGDFLRDLEDAKKKDEALANNDTYLYSNDEITKLLESNYTNKGAHGSASLAVGYKAKTETAASNSLAIGTEALAKQGNAVAIGTKAIAEGDRSISIGSFNTDGNKSTKAVGSTSVAIGVGAVATGNDAVTIGRNTEGGTAGVAVGALSKANGQYSVALGQEAEARGTESVAIGWSSNASHESAISIGERSDALNNNSIAIGREANSRGNASIVIGMQSNSGADNKTASWAVVIGNSAKAESATAGQTINDVVVVGGNSSSSASHTVAIGNGAKTTAESAVAIGKGVSAQGTRTVVIGHDAGTVNNAAPHPTSSVIIGDGARIGATTAIEHAIAVGTASRVTATGGIAFGHNANASKANSVAIGTNSANTATLTNAGYDPTTTRNYVGTASNIWTPNSGEFAVGNGATHTRRITGVAAGENDTDAVNVAQLKRVVGGSANLKYAAHQTGNDIFTNNQKHKTISLTDKGLNFKNTTNITAGVENDGVVTHSLNTNLTGMNSIAGQGTKVALGSDGITLSGENNTTPKKISGVANGTANNDAVNKSQLDLKADKTELAGKANAADLANKADKDLANVEKSAVMGKLDRASITGTDITVSNGTNAVLGTANVTLALDKEDAITEAKKASTKVATTKAVYDAIKSAKTTVSKKDNDQYIDVEKTESADNITANSYKVGLNITKVTESLANTFAKKDASNITGKETAWRTALDVYSKTETTTEIDKAKENVVGTADEIVVTPSNGTDNKTFTVKLADKVKTDIAAKADAGNVYTKAEVYTKNEIDSKTFGLQGDEGTGVTNTLGNKLTLKGDSAVAATGNIKVVEDGTTGLKIQLGKALTGVESISKGTNKGTLSLNDDHLVASHDIYVGSKADGNKLVKSSDLNTLGEASLTFKDGANTEFVRKNSESKTVTIKEGDIATTDFVGSNLKVKLNKGTGEFTIGMQKVPTFDSVKLGNGTNKVTLTPNADGDTLTFAKDPAGTDSKVKLSGLKDGDVVANSSDAVTGNQVYELKEAGLKFVGNTEADVVTTKLGGTLKIQGEGSFTGNTAAHNIKVDRKADNTGLDIKLAENLVGINKITTKSGDQNAEFSTTGLVAKGPNNAKAEVRSDAVEVNNDTDLSKLTPQGLEMTDKNNPGTSPKKNVLNKSSITLTDTTGGAKAKNDTNTITASKSELTDKDNNKATVTATGLSVTDGANNTVTLNKTGVTGATKVGKDDNNLITFGNGTADNVATVIKVGGKDLTISKKAGETGLALTGLEARDLAASANYGIRGNEGRAATEGALKALADTLGLNQPNNGTPGNTGATGNTGPAGKDGLNGESIVKKVEALRDGLAGNMVYTNGDGKRLQKANDGKYYEADDVTKEGYKVVEKDGKKYADVGNGNFKEIDPATKEIKAGTNEVALTGTTAPNEVDNNSIVLSAVNPDGSTTKPLTIGNLASALALNNVVTTDPKTSTAITADNAKTAIEGLLGKSGNDLTKVVTLADLQAVAQAGLNFVGNNSTVKLHNALSSTLEIKGEGAADTFASASGNIKVVGKTAANGGNNALEIQLSKDLNNIHSISSSTDKNKIDLSEDGKITFSLGANKETVKLDGVEEADITKDSNEAVSAKQLHELTTILGTTVAGNKTNFNSIENLLANSLLDKNGDPETAFKKHPTGHKDEGKFVTPLSLVGVTDEIIKKLNQGFYSYGDQGAKGTQPTDARIDPKLQYLGSKINVKSAATPIEGTGTKANKTFVGDNLITEYSFANGDSTISVGLVETPEFKEVTVKQNGDNYTKIGPTGTDIITKDGNDYVKTSTNKDGLTVSKVTDNTGNTPKDPAEKANYGLDGLTVTEGNKVSKLNNDEISIADGDKTTKLTKDSVEVKDGTDKTYAKLGGDSTNGGKLELKDDTGTGEPTIALDGKEKTAKVGDITVNGKDKSITGADKVGRDADNNIVFNPEVPANVTGGKATPANTVIKVGGSDLTLTKTDDGKVKISGLADPTAPNDAANKKYIDEAIAGNNSLAYKSTDKDGLNPVEKSVALKTGLNFKATENITTNVADNGEVTHTLNKALTSMTSVTTEINANRQQSEFSTTGLIAKTLDAAKTAVEKQTEVTSDGVEVSNANNKSKLTPDGLEMLDKVNPEDSPIKNVLNKSSITLTDTTGGATVKNDTNTITASKSELKDKDNNKATITATGLSVTDGVNTVTLNKDGVTGASKVGKDEHNLITFGTGNGDSVATSIAVGGKSLTLTKVKDNVRLSNVAKGVVATDAVNISQLKPYVTALGGNANINDTTGEVTGPTYELNAGGKGGAKATHTTVGDALTAIDTALSNLTDNPMSFVGNDGDVNKVSRKLGQTLKIQGEGTVAGATAANNIKVEKNATNDGLDVKLAEDLVGLNSLTTKTVDGKNTVLNTEGVTVTKGDNKSNLTADNLTFGPKDPNAADVDKTSTVIGKDGITVKGKDGNSDIEIKAGTDNAPASVALKGADGTSDSVKLTAADANNGGGIVVGDKNGKESVAINGSNGKDGASVVVHGKDGKDGNDGVTIQGSSDTDGSKVVLNGKDGKETIKLDTGNTTDKAPELAIKDKTGEKDSISLKGSDGTNAGGLTIRTADGTKDSVALKGADGTNGATLSLSGKDGTGGLRLDGEKGSITGVKDLAEDADGTSVTNKNYVDEKIANANAGQPLEYYTKEDDKKVVRGRDGKLYKEEDLADYKYDKASGKYKHKTTGTEIAADKALSNDKVIVKAMPGTDPISIGNVAAALANDKTAKYANATDKDVAVAEAKKLVAGENGTGGLVNNTNGTDLNKVVTLKDLQAVAISGLEFVGNEGKTHRTLGTTLDILGRVNGTTTKDFIYSDVAYTTKNVATKVEEGKVFVGIAEKPEFKGIDLKDPTKGGKTAELTPDSMTVTKVETPDANSPDKTKTTTTKVGADGTTITREDKTADPANPVTETAKYGIDGTELVDKGGNKSTLTAENLTFGPKEPNTAADKTSTVIGKNGVTVNGKDGKSDIEIKAGKDNAPASIALKGTDGTSDSVKLTAADGTNGGSVTVGNKDSAETIKLDGGNAGDKAPTITVNKADGTKPSVEIAGAKDQDNLGKVALKNFDGTKDLVTLSAGSKDQAAPALTLKDSTGTENSVVIKAKDGANGPSIDFARQTDPANNKIGTGKITGLANLTDADDGTTAANKNYVDSKLAEVKGDKPLEYTTADNKPVVRGQDGKLYKEEDLAGKVYVDKVGYVDKAKTELVDGKYELADAEKANKDKLKADSEALRVANKDVVLNAQPKGDGVISMGNIASGLGLDAEDTTYDRTVEKAKDVVSKLANRDKAVDDNAKDLDKVATVKDLEAIAMAGLDFGANAGEDIHRSLGEKVSIVGNADVVTKAAEKARAAMGLAAGDTIAKDKQAEYTEKLKAEVAKTHSNKNVVTVTDSTSNEIVINIADKPEFKAISIKDDEFAGKTLDLTPEAITMEADGSTTNMAADGLDVIDEVGNRNNIGADGIEITDTSGNTNSIGANEVHLVDEPNGKDSKLEAGKLVLIKSAGGGDKPEAHIITLEATDKGGRLTGLENRNTSSDKYGEDVSRAATESAVKKNRDDVENGVIGPMVYTDNQGNRVVKAEDGKYYAAKDVENGKAKTDAKAVENPALSLANGDRTGDTKAPVVLNNVASGTLSENSNQAVNGAQLHQTNVNVQNNSIRIDNLQNQVNTLDKDMRAGVAQAVAQANLPVTILPGKSTLSLATGHYMGTQAFAVGYSRVSDNGKVSVKFSVGHGGKQTSVGAGIGYTW